MNAYAPPLADLVLSLAALAGLWTLDRVLRAAGPDDPVVRRFRFGVFAVLLVFLGRSMVALTGAGALRFIEYIGAGLIPLAVLLLVEGLLRRHAPGWAKTLFAGGAIVMVILALLPAAWVDPGRILITLTLQVAAFAVAAWLVLTRDKGSLSASENRAAERLAVSLLLIVPLGASDFLISVLGLPVRPSGIAVLFLCWLAIGLWRGDGGGHRAPLSTFTVMVVCVAAVTWVVASGFGAERSAIIMIAALVLAAVLLSSVVADARAALAEAATPSILTNLSDWSDENPVAFFRSLAGHPAVAGAVFVDEPALSGLDGDVLDRLFAARPVLRRREAPPTEPDLADLCAHLFDRYEATHILQVRGAPRLLLALSLPSIAAGTRTEEELEVAQRMAALMESRNARA